MLMMNQMFKTMNN